MTGQCAPWTIARLFLGARARSRDICGIRRVTNLIPGKGMKILKSRCSISRTRGFLVTRVKKLVENTEPDTHGSDAISYGASSPSCSIFEAHLTHRLVAASERGGIDQSGETTSRERHARTRSHDTRGTERHGTITRGAQPARTRMTTETQSEAGWFRWLFGFYRSNSPLAAVAYQRDRARTSPRRINAEPTRARPTYQLGGREAHARISSSVVSWPGPV